MSMNRASYKECRVKKPQFVTFTKESCWSPAPLVPQPFHSSTLRRMCPSFELDIRYGWRSKSNTHTILHYTPEPEEEKEQNRSRSSQALLRCKIKKNNQNFTKAKLHSYQNGTPRRLYVIANSIAAEFQSKGPIPQPAQLRADKLLHNITNSCEIRAARAFNQRTRTPNAFKRRPLREKTANIFYRKRKKKSNQKVSQTLQKSSHI